MLVRACHCSQRATAPKHTRPRTSTAIHSYALLLDDQRRPPVECPRRFLRAVVPEALLAIARYRQPRRLDPALRQIVPNRACTALSERLVVRRTPLRAGVALDLQAHRRGVVQRLQR